MSSGNRVRTARQRPGRRNRRQRAAVDGDVQRAADICRDAPHHTIDLREIQVAVFPPGQPCVGQECRRHPDSGPDAAPCCLQVDDNFERQRVRRDRTGDSHPRQD